MTDVQTVVVHVLADHLNGRQTLSVDVDWNELFAVAEQHEINGIVYHQCKSFMPNDIAHYFEQKCAAEIYYYYNRVRLMNRLESHLRASQVQFFSVKGLVLSGLYPIPALRTMGDCDIVVRSEDKERVHELMLELGFECTFQASHEWKYIKNNMEFEIHDHLLYDEPGAKEAWIRFMDTMWDYVDSDVLSWDFHYVFLLMHIEKHLTKYGIGIRQFMDLYVVIKNKSLNWAWINRKLEELGLRGFSDRCLELVNYWFCEQKVGVFDSEFVELATNRILGNGVFGFDDENNDKNCQTRRLIRSGNSSFIGNFKRMHRVILLPYESLRKMPHYEFVDGKPWLMPCAWVYRIYRTIRYRDKEYIVSSINRNIVSSKELETRKREFTMWGL